MKSETDPRTDIARQNIRIACVMRDMSQTEVSRKAGLSRNTVSQYTAGRTNISFENMHKVCDVLGIPIGVVHKRDGLTTERIRLYRILEAMPEHLVSRAIDIAKEWDRNTDGRPD